MDTTINVIFDNRHTPQDYERLIEEFKTNGVVKYKFWDAIILKHSVVASINASHKMIVRWAKENKKKQVVIAEQDLMFTCPNSWMYFLDNKPEEFDLYLWGSYIVPLSNKCVCGFHLYVIHEKFYDRFLSVDENLHIDTAMDDLKGDYHYCYPFPALQRPGYSANNPGNIVNYNSILNNRPEDIYKG